MAPSVSCLSTSVDPPRIGLTRRVESMGSDRSARSDGSVHTVVALRGELDAAALSALVDTFDDAIGRDGTDVVVDLADVDFIGAAWIGTLVRSRAVLRLQNRDLSLRAPSRVVFRLLDLCGLAYLIEPTSS